MNSRPWTRFYPPKALEPLELAFGRLSELPPYAANTFGDAPALTLDDHVWSFRQLNQAAELFAAKLSKCGVGPGARVAILLPNLPEYVAALFGTWMAGGTVVQINPAYVAPEIDRILEHSGSKALVTNGEQIGKLKEGGIALGLTTFEARDGDLLQVGSPAGEPYDARTSFPDASSELALLQYTGGTTGLPKSVMLTHQNVLSNIEQRLRVTLGAMDVPPGASVVNTLPMCHVYGLTCVTLSSVQIGMNQLIVPRFHARSVLELIRSARPFVFHGVPTMYAAFLREPDLEAFGLESVQVFNSAGAPMPPAHWQQFRARTTAQVLSGFGITEASPSTHTYPSYIPRRKGSSGIPIPYTDVRVVRHDGDVVADVPKGEVGEMLIKGPQVMKGYWNDSAATDETLKDGWLHTGDLVRVDEDGYLFVVGRQKDVIVASGYNVYPAEIERVIGAMPTVAEVAVVGMAHEYRGETIKAVVVPLPGANVFPDDVVAQCRKELAPFKVPTHVEIIDALPRTPVGKIDKRALAG